MRRPPTSRPLLLLFLLHVLLLLASSRVSGLRPIAGGDTPLVVFSSFPTFTPETGGGPRAPTTAALHSNFKEKSHHGVPSDSHRGVPFTTGLSGAEGRAMAENTNAAKDDAPKTGIFQFSTQMKEHRQEMSTDAEEFTTLVAAQTPDETTTISDTTEISAPPTADPVIVYSEEASSPPSLTTTHPRTLAFAQESGTQGQPDEAGKSEPKATEASVSPGSLASMLQRMKSSPRPSTKPARERKEKEDSPQQMTLAERLKALQARRAARLGSQARRGTGLLRRNNSPPQPRESPMQRRLGDFSVSNSEGETRQKTLNVEPTISFIAPPPEGEGEKTLSVNEHDMVGEEASLVSTTQSEPPRPEASSPTSTKPALKKRPRLTHTQRLRERLQELRERRLSSTTPRPRFPRPVIFSRPRATPGPKTENTTAALTPSQRRRQKFYQRLRNRTFTTRAPIGAIVNATQEKDPKTTSEAPVRNQPPQRLSFLPTTKRPLSFREKIQQFRNRNRFVPASKRRQLTSTTTATTTTTTSTTPPPTTVTTTLPPTTIGTTPALAVNTWPVTEAPDDDNFLITVPTTTESSESSRRLQIRKMIDAMLSSKGFSGPTTTEQVLSLLEIATSRPVFMHTTESLLRTLPKHSGILRPTFPVPGAEDEKSRSETFLDDLLTTITESVSVPTTQRPFTAFTRDRPKPFQHFSSLADKLAASHAPKQSKHRPSSTPPTPTTEESSATTLPENSAGALDLVSGTAEETDTDATTTIPEVEITTPFSSFTTLGAEEDEPSSTTQEPLAGTTAKDQRVKNLISKLLAQGVITMSLPDDSETVTPPMEDALPATTTDTPPPALMPSPRPKLPQLTRGAPPGRIPVRSGSPFTDNPLVSTVKMMDTTAKFSKDDTDVTEAPQTTTPDDALLQTNLFQTTPPVTEAGDSVFGIAGDLGENEIDAVNSKDNLHSLMRSFGRSSIRPELAAVNQVLGFSLTTDDVVSPVEVSLEKPQTPGEEDVYDDLEVAATEQVMITTILRDEDLAPTPHNLDVTSLSVSEPSPQIHSATEATNLSAADTAGERYSETGTEEQAASIKEAATSIEENPDSVQPPVTVFAIADSKPPAMHTPTTTQPVPDTVDPQGNKKPSVDKHSVPSSPPTVAKGTLMLNVTAENQSDNKTVTTLLQKFLRQGAPEKADDSPSDPTDTFQGVSQAVLRERLHLLRLMKERQGGRAGQETPLERLRTTSESPSTTSRVSLSELIRKKTSGEVTEPEMTPRSPLSEPNTTTETTVTTAGPEPRPTAAIKQAQTKNTSKTSDAMRRFLELNKHVLQTLRAKKKAAASTEAPPPPATSTLPTTPSTTRPSIPDLGTKSSGSDNEGIPPVITQVTPQFQITSVSTLRDQNQPHEGTKVRTSSLLRPVSQLPDRSKTPSLATDNLESASASNVQRPASHEHEGQLIKEKQEPSTPRTAVTTIRSRIPPPFRVRRPHPPTKFSLSRPVQDSPEQQQQQQPGTSFLPGPSESVLEGPQVVSTTSRPLLQVFSTTHAADAPATEIAKPDEPIDDASQPSEVRTERPTTVRVTTLASLLNRKHIPSTRFHQAKQKPTLLPKTTTENMPATTKQPEDDTLAPVTLPAQEETTIIPQPSNGGPETPAPHVDQSKAKLSDNSLQPPSVKGTISATEGMTVEHVPPSLTFPDTNVNLRTELQDRPAGAFKPGVASFSVPGGVPLPFPASDSPHTVFPTTIPPSIQFEPTHIPTRLPSREATHGLDASATTESPSSFPTNPQDLTDEKSTLTPPSFSLGLDTSTPPFGFNVQLQQEPLSPDAGLPPSFPFPPATNDGPFTAGDDASPGKPLLFFTTTSAPGFASFTLGRNEAFFSDDEPKATTFHPPMTEIPVVTTPITTVTPQVILLALPVVNGPIVASSLLPEEDTETHIPSTTTGRQNEQPSESVSPPDLKHMITKGVTITSTEGVIDRVPPTAAPESPSPPHSLLVPPPTDPTFLNLQTEQNSPQNIFQREDEEPRLRFASESLSQVVASEHSLGATEEKKLKGETTLNEQQVLVHTTRRPSLQAGHLNLNELRQHHLAGQVTEKVSQGLPTPSGFQEQQSGSQVFVGQPNVPQQRSNIVAAGQPTLQDPQQHPRERKIVSGQHNIGVLHISEDRPASLGQHTIETQHTLGQGEVISNQQTVGVLQTHDEGQTTPGHRNFQNQHISDQGQVRPGQHGRVQNIVEQRQKTPGQQNLVNQHAVVQGHVVQGQRDIANGDTLEQRKGVTGHDTTVNQQTLVRGQRTHQQHIAGARNVNEGGQATGQQSTSQHAFNQEQGTPNQHVSAVHQQNVHQHDTLTQQDSQGHIIQGQQTPQTQVVQHHHNEQAQIIQGQHNLQSQVIQSQHNQQGQITQDQHNPQGQIFQGQHNQQGQIIPGQQNHQEEVIQDQHNPQRQVIDSQHNQQAEVIPDQHNSQRQIIQDQHNPQTQTIQDQHNTQEQILQGQHNPQAQINEGQHIPQGQVIEGQHNQQGHVIQGQHILQEQGTQGQHNQQGQVIQGQHILHEEGTQGQHNQGQVIQGQHILHEEGTQGQHNQQGQVIQGQHILHEEGTQGQHNQGQVIQGQHILHEEGTQGQHNQQGQVIQGQHILHEEGTQGQHNQGQVIQGQHILQEQSTQGQHNQQGQVIQGQHILQEEGTQGQHNQQGQVMQGQHILQEEGTQGQHNQQGQVIQGQHILHEEGTQGQHNQQGQVIQGQHILQEEGTQGQHNQQGQVIQGQHILHEEGTQGQHNQQGQVIQGQHILQEEGTQGQHNQQGQVTQGQHILQEEGTQGQHGQQGEVPLGQQVSQGQVIQGHHHPHQQDQSQHGGAQGTLIVSEGQQSTQGQSSQGQDLTRGQFFQGQDVIQGQISQGQGGTQEQASQGQDVVQGQSSQEQARGQVSQGPDVIQGQISQGQRGISQGQIGQGQDVIQEQTSRGREVIQGPHIQKQDVIQGQEVPEQHIPTTQHTFQEGQAVTQHKHERQQDATQHVTQGAQGQQFQNSQPPQQNSRRGKFISGDAVLGAQLIAPVKNSEGKLTVQNIHGSGGPIITGHSVVPPLQASQQRQPQRRNGVQSISRRQNNGSRGRTREQDSRNQKQKVQVDARQRLATQGSTPAPPRGPAILGHFSNSAAGFLRGPANSVVTGFSSLSDDLPAGGGEGNSRTNVLPAAAKVPASPVFPVHSSLTPGSGTSLPAPPATNPLPQHAKAPSPPTPAGDTVILLHDSGRHSSFFSSSSSSSKALDGSRTTSSPPVTTSNTPQPLSPPVNIPTTTLSPPTVEFQPSSNTQFTKPSFTTTTDTFPTSPVPHNDHFFHNLSPPQPPQPKDDIAINTTITSSGMNIISADNRRSGVFATPFLSNPPTTPSTVAPPTTIFTTTHSPPTTTFTTIKPPRTIETPPRPHQFHETLPFISEKNRGFHPSTATQSSPNLPLPTQSATHSPIFPQSTPNLPPFTLSTPKPFINQSTPNSSGFTQSTPNPPIFTQSTPNPSGFTQSTPNPSVFPQSSLNPPLFTQSTPNHPTFTSSTPNPPSFTQSVSNPSTFPQSTSNPVTPVQSITTLSPVPSISNQNSRIFGLVPPDPPFTTSQPIIITRNNHPATNRPLSIPSFFAPPDEDFPITNTPLFNPPAARPPSNSNSFVLNAFNLSSVLTPPPLFRFTDTNFKNSPPENINDFNPPNILPPGTQFTTIRPPVTTPTINEGGVTFPSFLAPPNTPSRVDRPFNFASRLEFPKSSAPSPSPPVTGFNFVLKRRDPVDGDIQSPLVFDSPNEVIPVFNPPVTFAPILISPSSNSSVLNHQGNANLNPTFSNPQDQFLLNVPSFQSSSLFPPTTTNPSLPTINPQTFPTTNPSAFPTSSLPNTNPSAFSTSSLPNTNPSAFPTSSFPNTSPSAFPTSSFPITNPSAFPTSSLPNTNPSVFSTSSLPNTNPSAFSTSSLPNTNPSVFSTSSLPNTNPSAFPTSSHPNTNPSAFPTSSLPNTNPSVFSTSSLLNTNPSPFPTTVPQSFPATNPSFPATTPQTFPTANPSAFPNTTPPHFLTTDPSAFPTTVPLVFPTTFHPSFPTSTPAFFPITIPAAFPTTAPLIFPASNPTAFLTSSPPGLHTTSEPSGLFLTPIPATFPPAEVENEGNLGNLISPQNPTIHFLSTSTPSNLSTSPTTLPPRLQERLTPTPASLDFGIPNTPANQDGSIQLFPDPPSQRRNRFRLPLSVVRSPALHRLIPTPVPTSSPPSPLPNSPPTFPSIKDRQENDQQFHTTPRSQLVSSSPSPFSSISPVDDASLISNARVPSAPLSSRLQSSPLLGFPISSQFPSTPSSSPLLVSPPPDTSSSPPSLFSLPSSTISSPFSSSSTPVPPFSPSSFTTPASSSSSSTPGSQVSSSPTLASLLLPNSTPLVTVSPSSLLLPNASPSSPPRTTPQTSFLLPHTPSTFPPSTPTTFIPFSTSPSSLLVPNTPFTSTLPTSHPPLLTTFTPRRSSTNAPITSFDTPFTSTPPASRPSLPHTTFTPRQRTTSAPTTLKRRRTTTSTPTTTSSRRHTTTRTTTTTSFPRKTTTNTPTTLTPQRTTTRASITLTPRRTTTNTSPTLSTTIPPSTPQPTSSRTLTNNRKQGPTRRRNRGRTRFTTAATTLSPNHDATLPPSSNDIPSTPTRGPSLLLPLDGGKERDSESRLPVGQDPDADEIPGRAGIDYPIRTTIPVTAFTCTPAMANMMFADPDTGCQVYHVCSGHHKFSFLCPKGTLFNQDTSVCQWWFTVDCARQARRLAEVRGLAAG